MIPSSNLPLDDQLALLIEGGWYRETVELAEKAHAEGALVAEAVDAIKNGLSNVPASANPGDVLYGLDAGKSWTVFSSLLFRRLTSYEDMKKAFKQGITKVEIETSTLCNRHCAYCPNDTLDVPHRRTINEFPDFDLFQRTQTNLREIDYAFLMNKPFAAMVEARHPLDGDVGVCEPACAAR